MNRIPCALPKVVKSFCETGCVYREKAFRHLACPKKLRLKDACASPCKTKECDCFHKKEFVIVSLTKKEKNEMFLL